jgi:N-dimethylarginine dimethylaminohydrolase
VSTPTDEENTWGRRYLMCPPAHFEILYRINPWMLDEVPVDPDRAQAQWDALVALLRAAGATIELQEPRAGLPDLVFTANAGLVNGDRFVPSRFRNPERQGEMPHDIAWFEAAGWDVRELPAGVSHEGAGDALPFGGVILSGHHWRSDLDAQPLLADLLRVPVRPVGLTDERFYHLDITFCPLDDRHAITTPAVWDAAGAETVAALVPEPLALDLHEAETFCANSVVVGRNVVMTACPPRVGRQLEAWGFEVEVADVSEFLKAGGGVRCLTLALDVALP